MKTNYLHKTLRRKSYAYISTFTVVPQHIKLTRREIYIKNTREEPIDMHTYIHIYVDI